MVNAAALSLAGSAAVPQAGAVRATAPAFSYDDAVAALERQSAQSLDIHGGRPDAPIGAAPDARGASPAAAETGSARARPATTRPDQGARAQAVPSTEVAAHAAPAPHPAPASAAVVAAAPAAASITSPAPAQPLSASAALRETAARVKAEATRAPVPVRTPAATVKQFAEILAQRLDNASQFDLRLDPPALGTVEGRLTLGDDGEARLALSFDNQSAFDLFRRDEASLRFALADAGFDLGGRNLQFSFREPPRENARGAARPSPAPAATASLHRGAVDIRA